MKQKLTSNIKAYISNDTLKSRNGRAALIEEYRGTADFIIARDAAGKVSFVNS
jgi:hypothetical protein